MKIRTKSNFFTLRILLILTIVFFQLSCKKEEPLKFSTESFLYFINKDVGNTSINANNIKGLYYPETKFSFFVTRYQMDTIKVNETFGFILSIQMDGKLSDKNRKILLEVEGSGKEYCVLPHPDSIYIPANGIQLPLNLKLIRPPLSDTAMKTVTITLRNNDHFSPEGHVWHKITYQFGNWFDRPPSYDDIEAICGEFSPAKMYAMQLAVSRLGAAVWQTDPDVITLNSFLKNRNEREVKFDPFSFNELYYFIDYARALVVYYQPTGPVLNSYNALLRKMVALTQALIVERRNAGNPILDQLGNEINFPQ